MAFFSTIKTLESEIDKFFSHIQESGLHFSEGIREYLSGNMELFESRIKTVRELEQNADELRRNIRFHLYNDMLIPDSRGDVLGLLETTDSIIDQVKKVLTNFSNELPQIPDEYKGDFQLLADHTTKTINEFKLAATAFFNSRKSVNDHINQVYFYETEIDKVEERLKRGIFQDGIVTDFSQKIHLRYFTEKAANVSDIVEDVCERLTISAIKRSI